ncbi:putative galactose-1-phosphate uridyltransferase [Dorcoceras hygrometricum]|uniref:Putative galactose-1-phosphate uridyltransferase n=1 Tax=Dorcoceras hygrometricum TaxID=472368 RepID=A0A2Z7BUH0_9LAMI|nr:putative galactose-1-phosphate uridyltransferase [Dorcoceras hygrometricum]
MAALFIHNALQVNFDSVLSLTDEGMVSMFKALESSELRGFLGCSTTIYEKDLVTLFENAIVIWDAVISSVQGMFVEISKEHFSRFFDLPLEGLTSKESDEEETHEKEKDKEATDSEDTVTLRKVEEPTRILFNHGIEIREVDWYKATLPKIEPADKGKEPLIRDAVVEEIATFFHSFSIRSISALKSISDLVAKEAQMLKWAETDSLWTEVQRRMYITDKYREMLLRKFLEARNQNFFSGTPTSSIDLQVLDLLSEAHRITLINLLEQLRQHKLKWTWPYSSIFLEELMYRVAEFTQKFTRALHLLDPKPVKLALPTISIQKKKLPQRLFVDAFAPICVFIEPVQDTDSRRTYSAIFQKLWRKFGVSTSYLSGTCAWLQPVFQEPGASRLIAVDSSIRSTTKLEAPSSDCTRSPDEISTIGFSTSNWPEQISGNERRRRRRRREWRGGEGGYA